MKVIVFDKFWFHSHSKAAKLFAAVLATESSKLCNLRNVNQSKNSSDLCISGKCSGVRDFVIEMSHCQR